MPLFSNYVSLRIMKAHDLIDDTEGFKTLMRHTLGNVQIIICKRKTLAQEITKQQLCSKHYSAV